MIGVWELAARTGTVNPDILPPPSEWFPYLLQGPGATGIGPQQVTYGEAIITTLTRVIAGLGIGLAIALALGTLVSWFRPVRRILMPMVQTIAPVAPVAWVPVVIAVVGIGDRASITVVVLAVAASMTIATVAAIGSVPENLIKSARSLGAGRVQTALWVIGPAAAPSLLTMLRLNMFAAWMAVLAGEMAGVDAGLGAMTLMGQQQFNMKLVMIGVVTIGVLGFICDQVLLFMQRRLLRGREGQVGAHA
jgi:NitT/TauT family transport system permease protein